MWYPIHVSPDTWKNCLFRKLTINNNLPRRLRPQRSTPPPLTPTSPFFTGPPPLPLHTLFSLLPDTQRNEKGEVAERAFFQPVAPRAVLFHNFSEHLYSSRRLLINPSSARNLKLKHLNEVINQINPIEVHIRLLAPSPPHFQLAPLQLPLAPLPTRPFPPAVLYNSVWHLH